MKHAFARHGSTLIPGDERAAQAIKRLEPGEVVLLSMSRVRSGQWHRLFMGGCTAIANNCEPALTADAVKDALKLYAGHVTLVKDRRGNELMVPKSIAFDKLTADEWSELFPSLDKAALEHFGFSFDLFSQGMAGFYD